MLEQKRILEYEIADLRLDTEDNNASVYYSGTVGNRIRGSRCVLHKTNGQQAEDCWNYKALKAAEN